MITQLLKQCFLIHQDSPHHKLVAIIAASSCFSFSLGYNIKLKIRSWHPDGPYSKIGTHLFIDAILELVKLKGVDVKTAIGLYLPRSILSVMLFESSKANILFRNHFIFYFIACSQEPGSQ